MPPSPLNITPTNEETVGSNGIGLLNENTDGSVNRIELGTIGDNIETTAVVSYRLADPADSNNNDQFQIDDGKLYYIGTNSGDFEADTKIQYTLDIIRTLDGNAQTDQRFQYIVNLKDVNDNPPVIIGYIGESETLIAYLAAGTVEHKDDTGTEATSFDVAYAMVFRVYAEGQTITIDFERGTAVGLAIVPKYADAENPTIDTLTGFIITTGTFAAYSTIAEILNGAREDALNSTTEENFDIWLKYMESVAYTGKDTNRGPPAESPPGTANPFLTEDAIFTNTQGIIIEADTPTTEIIANFKATDADVGDTLKYRLSGDDAGGFTIDENTGELRLANTLSFNTGENADNQYAITIIASDGIFRDKFDLLVVVADMQN